LLILQLQLQTQEVHSDMLCSGSAISTHSTTNGLTSV